MSHDLIIKNGKIVDGSGIPGFHGDVAISGGSIVEIGKVSGGAHRVLNADGLVVAPGIVDNHTHYDAQVTWDPLCTFSCYHGATTVVIGNCSLAVAPAHEEDREVLASVLSHVEAIPLEAIRAGVVTTPSDTREPTRSSRGTSCAAAFARGRKRQARTSPSRGTENPLSFYPRIAPAGHMRGSPAPRAFTRAPTRLPRPRDARASATHRAPSPLRARPP